jgi:CRP/FNR family transcriptional regulator
MTRTDIANYLRQAPETVSRVLRRFETEGLLHIKQRDVEIVDMERLQALALAVLRE